jgi:tRNA(Ile)-lysidine synthase TilS/MesJ
MKCATCRQPASVELPGQRSAFCPPCFVRHIHEKVDRTISGARMLGRSERALVAVSGGKDSLCVWDVLVELGFATEGVYLDLGIGAYSERSKAAAASFAEQRGLVLNVVDVASELGAGIPDAARVGARSACGVCGLSKRHLLNRAALERGFDVVVTGHNLDDEAAVLLGNVLSWNLDQLSRQRPVLASQPGFARRVKPLVRTSEWEAAAYCVVRGIDYVVEECPMAAGNRHLFYKELLGSLEERSPGTSAAFYRGFQRRLLPVLDEALAERDHEELVDGEVAGRQSLGVQLRACEQCGSPTTGSTCAFCRVRAQVRRRARRPANPSDSLGVPSSAPSASTGDH